MYSCIAIKCYYPLNIEKHFTYFDNLILLDFTLV